MNGHETEVKFFVRDLDPIEMRLRVLKAHLIQPRTHETNLRFDNENNDLRRSSRVLRLRQDEKARFTFKGPSEEMEGGVLGRQEIEFVVEDFSNAKLFLEALGFKPVVFYEKFRTTYELNGIHIMLDELPYGKFVEIEGEQVQELRRIADLLEIKWENMVKAGYHALFDRAARKYGLESSRLSFDALAGVDIDPRDMEIQPAD